MFNIDLYQAYIKDLYSQANQQRDFADIYGNLHRSIAAWGRSISLKSNDVSKFVLSVAWLFSLANFLDIKIQEAFFKKYSRPNWGLNDHPNDVGFDKRIEHITELFPSNQVIWQITGYQSQISRIHEKLAEIHEIYGEFKSGRKTLGAVGDEIIEFFSLLLNTWAILNPEQSLDKAFIDYYANGCPICKSAPCTCGLYDSRPSKLPKTDLLTMFQSEAEKISTVYLDSRSGGVFFSNSASIKGDIAGITDASRPRLAVFLCHSSNDKPKARELFQRLRKDGFNPWLDEMSLLPGQDWQYEIPKAVRESDIVIVCLSKASINKTGYVQKEIKYALDVADEQPEGTIFIIPLRLEECEVPIRLRKWHWVSLFTDDGYDSLIRSLKAREYAKAKNTKS